MIQNKFLFNFAVSYAGGGFKRLHEYAKWFDQHGGAWFIVHPRCEFLIDKFPSNRFFIINQLNVERLYNDCGYLKNIRLEIGTPDLYYSYGIPVFYKVGRVNWFHLSNVLPLSSQSVPLALFDRLKFNLLGKRIIDNLNNADVISAESNFSLNLMNSEHAKKMFLSVNGSDDEITLNSEVLPDKTENIATVIGTYRYKAIEDSFYVFQMLQEKNTELKLVIIGDDRNISRSLKMKSNVIVTGSLQREHVIQYLRKTKYYISTTHIENSYNAASEGIFIANESFISNIDPHRELIANMPYDEITVPAINRRMLHVKKENLSTENLKTWDTVILDMISHIQVETPSQVDIA